MKYEPKALMGEYYALKGDRATWDSRWQTVKEWLDPHNAHITEIDLFTPTNEARSKIHDTKGIEALQVLTSAHMSYITPLNEDWLGFTAARTLKATLKEAGEMDAVDGYFKKCSEVAMEAIGLSGFYTAIYAVYKDRSSTGTGAMMLKKGKNGGCNFQYIPVGTYCFAEGEDMLPNCFFREYELTLDQAVMEFGEDMLGDKLKALYMQSKEDLALLHSKHKFLHVVKERKERDESKDDKENMPFYDCNLCMTDNKMMSEGGFQEFPYLVSRYERWGNHIWGFAPSYNAMPNILSANYIRKLQKTLGEVAAFPRIIQLAGEKRQIDLRAGGRTTISRESAQLNFPREWGTTGRFDVGMALLDKDHECIDQFFHVPLFRMFSSIEKTMTATEVGAREREKLLLFAPSFTQFVTDMSPLMVRLFAMLARENKFPAPPEALIQTRKDGQATIPNPEVVFQSRISLAIKSLQTEGFDRVMQRAGGLLQIQPDILDNWDFDMIFRDMSRNEGYPESWLKMKENVDKLRQSRAQQQLQQQQAAEAEQLAGAVGSAGGAEQVQRVVEGVQGNA